MRKILFWGAQAIQSAVSAKIRFPQPEGSRNSPTTSACCGSIRESVDLSSVIIQRLSLDAARIPGADPVPNGCLETIFAVFASIFSSDPSPHAAAHRKLNAFTTPPQGLETSAMESRNLFSFALGSIRAIPFFAGSGRRTLSVTAIQAGFAGVA